MHIPVITVAIIQSRTGTGWTIDTTLANLDADTTLKDFVVLFGSTVQPNSVFTKLSSVSVRYDGASLSGTAVVQLRRRTPIEPAKEVLYGERMSSSDWNREINRVSRRAAEYESFGIGSIGDVTGVPNNGVYGVTWSTDTIFAPTRQSVYNKIEALVVDYTARDAVITSTISGFAPINNAALTGTPTAPTPSNTTTNTQLQTTAGVKSLLSDATVPKTLAAVALDSTSTGTTQGRTDNDTSIATTAFAHLASVAKRISVFTFSAQVNGTSSFTNLLTTGNITPRSNTSSFLVVLNAHSLHSGGNINLQRLVADATTIDETRFYSVSDIHMKQTMMGVYTPGNTNTFTVKFSVQVLAGALEVNDTTFSNSGSRITVIEFDNNL